MGYRLTADALVLFHFAFILFTFLGGFIVLRWPWVAVLHLPAAAWGVIVQVVVGGACPLTKWEWHYRDLGGQAGYGEGFIDHYITSLIYVENPPAWLHPALGAFVLVLNLAIYTVVILRWRQRTARQAVMSVNV